MKREDLPHARGDEPAVVAGLTVGLIASAPRTWG